MPTPSFALDTPWYTYTPALTATTTPPTMGSGAVQDGRYLVLGNLCIVQVRISFGTGMAAGSGDYQISLPVAIASGVQTDQCVGSGGLYDSSVNTHVVIEVERDGSQTLRAVMNNNAAGHVTHAAPFAWAASDQINLLLMYEIA